jgi:uncharacterized protein DUF3616
MSYKKRIIFPVAGMVIILGYATLSFCEMAAKARVTAFTGGMFEASGVAHAPGTDGVLFVDDGRPDEIFWMRLDANGAQAGPVKPVPLGVSVVDLEGITTDGAYFYVVGSQSKSKGVDQAGLVRFRYDAQQQRVEGAESISGLKRFLAENVAELRGMGDKSYKAGGINIEGVAWDPQMNRLLLGLRSPVINGHALVAPLKMRDPGGPFALNNFEVENGRAIRLPSGGAGIRSIEYDGYSKAFRILTGAAAKGEKTDFKLWEWNGDPNQPTLRGSDTFDRTLKPEGVTRFWTGARALTFVVFDTSGYAAIESIE